MANHKADLGEEPDDDAEQLKPDELDEKVGDLPAKRITDVVIEGVEVPHRGIFLPTMGANFFDGIVPIVASGAFFFLEIYAHGISVARAAERARTMHFIFAHSHVMLDNRIMPNLQNIDQAQILQWVDIGLWILLGVVLGGMLLAFFRGLFRGWKHGTFRTVFLSAMVVVLSEPSLPRMVLSWLRPPIVLP